MAGAETGFVVGLISATITIIEATKAIYDSAKDAQGQPEAFRQVAARLPLVARFLHNARARASALNETEQEALEPVLESCKVKTEALWKIFQKVVRRDGDGWYERYKKAAVATVGKRTKVEALMRDILRDIHVLATEKLMEAGTNAEKKEIEEAIKEMENMPSSLTEDIGDALQQHHSGSGDNYGATGRAIQNIHKGTGDMYHNRITGDAHFGANITLSQHLPDQLDKKCLRSLRVTNPRDDKTRIKETKGGLLKDLYQWVFRNIDFQQWRYGQQGRLLWIKGDPGKGKTMLLCGIVDELEDGKASTALLAYFFCQATDSRINSATAVLRGLLYLLVDQQPSLVSHIRAKYDQAGRTLFEDVNAWVALREIFTNILQDSSLGRTHLIIDALDECVVDRQRLLDFIVKQSSSSSTVKWIVSSRNWPEIEQQLAMAGHGVQLSLEVNSESVATAVNIYIQQKVIQLSQSNRYDASTRELVHRHLSSNADGTFLWVALVCQSLKAVPKRHVLKKLSAFPPGLDSLYERMMEHIVSSDDADLCKEILALIATTYQPLTLQEIITLVEPFEDAADDPETVEDIIGRCGSFLTTRENIVYFVHQSAKDFLVKKAANTIFPSGTENAHYAVFSRSLKVLSNSLCRDMYNLHAPGYPIERVAPPDPDPLGKARYSSIYWVDHLNSCGSIATTEHIADLQDGGIIDQFLRQNYLYWLEALSLCKSMSKGVVSLAELEAIIHKTTSDSALRDLVKDARRFVMYHNRAIEEAPLQAYVSALVFSPRLSLIRNLFKQEAPPWISIKPPMRENWSACLQTLEGHSSSVNLVAFSYDSTRLGSASEDGIVKIWDAASGACLQTLEGHNSLVNSVAFSHDLTRLATTSLSGTVKIWDTASSVCLQTLKGHSGLVHSVAFSRDSTRLALTSLNGTVKIWDAASGACLQMLEGHRGFVNSVAFSHDLTRLASTSFDGTVKICDTVSSASLQMLKGHSDPVRSIAFSQDSVRLASASDDGTVKIWNIANGACLQTLKGHNVSVRSVAFSHDSTRLVSASSNGTVKIWDAADGVCLQTHEGHSSSVDSVTFSYDSMQLASASNDCTVKIWDTASSACPQTLESHSDSVDSVAFSYNSMRLASASNDCTIKIWDTASGACLQTLKGHSSLVNSVTFSYDSTRLASASKDRTIKIWDTASGACLQTLEGHSGLVNLVAFSHDLTRLALTLFDSTIKIWDIVSSACQQTLKGHSSLVNSVTFSHDLRRLASACNNRTIKIWDAASGVCLQTLRGHRSSVRSIAFSHDLMRLASASNDRTVKIWDTASGVCLQTLKGHRNSVNLVAFSNNLTRLASASNDCTAKIWDVASGACLQTLKGHSGWVGLVAFSHDSTGLASASADRTVKIWDAASGACLQTLDVGRTLLTLSFNNYGSGLLTEIGAFDLDTTSSSSSSSNIIAAQKSKTPQYQATALSLDKTWITCDSQNVVRLPSEYRPYCSTVQENMIGIGVGSGRVWMCSVKCTRY